LHDNAPNTEIIPLSALKGEQIECLEQTILDKMPEDVFYFSKDSNSNQSKSFHMSEIVREKLMRTLEQEVPYSIAVEIEKFEDTDKITHIHALIWVERDAQKGIVVGKGGAQLKKVGTSARIDLEKFLGKKVCLKLWVKVKANWADQASLLETMVG
jgi:GTP-binding protein Era